MCYVSTTTYVSTLSPKNGYNKAPRCSTRERKAPNETSTSCLPFGTGFMGHSNMIDQQGPFKVKKSETLMFWYFFR